MTYLLDINVLVALFDTAHVHHDPAHRWLASVAPLSWATCPLSENGFVRIVSNPKYPTAGVTPEDAAARLRAFCSDPGHIFWPDDISLFDPACFDLPHLRGHQQVTDVYLAGLAARHRGKIATFDGSIATRVVVGAIFSLAQQLTHLFADFGFALGIKKCLLANFLHFQIEYVLKGMPLREAGNDQQHDRDVGRDHPVSQPAQTP